MIADVLELFKGFECNGWNEQTMMILLAQFILENGLEDKFRQSLEDQEALEQADGDCPMCQTMERVRCPRCATAKPEGA